MKKFLLATAIASMAVGCSMSEDASDQAPAANMDMKAIIGAMFETCDKDIERLCPSVEGPEALACLLEKTNQASTACAAKLKALPPPQYGDTPPPAGAAHQQDQLGNPPPQGVPNDAPPQGGMSRVDLVLAAIGEMDNRQTDQVKAVLQSTEDAIKKLQQTMPVWNDKSMAAINKLWDTESDNLASVLNEQQFSKYKQWVTDFLAERAKDQH